MSGYPLSTIDPELLANGHFPENWEVIGPKGTWELNPAGELTQKSLIGNKQPGTGAILAQKETSVFPIQELKLICRPGSQHIAGVIFNLVDEKNFCAFCIDRHTRRARNYHLVVFEMKEGDYNVISKEIYRTNSPDTVSFTLRQMGRNLHFLFNDSLSYVWADKSLSGNKFGLYSYKNKDAGFLSFAVLPRSNDPAALGAKTMETQPARPYGNITSQPSLPIQALQPIVPFDTRDGIKEFLNIKKPASKTEIEFTEVFTVPLDSFYSSLYLNSNLDGSDQSVASGVSEVQLLDLRVKRWYRDLKAVREDLIFAKGDLIRKKDRVTEAETKLGVARDMDEEEYAELEKNLVFRRTEYRIASNKVNRLRDQEQLVFRELRVNGYAVIENTTILAIQALGYDFHIISQSVAPSSYIPLKFAADLNLSDDGVWEDAEQQLYHQLFDSGTVTEKGASLYQIEKTPLSSFNDNPVLVEKAEQLQVGIDQLGELRPIYVANLEGVEKDLNEWKDDKNVIDSNRGIGDPRVEVRSWDEASEWVRKLTGWLIDEDKHPSSQIPYPDNPNFQGFGDTRYQLTRFTADCYINEEEQPDWSAIDDAKGGELYVRLGIYCPTDLGGILSFNFDVRFYCYYPYVEFESNPSEDPSTWDTYWGYKDELEFGDVDSSGNPDDFFKIGMQVCDYFCEKARVAIDAANSMLSELDAKLALHQEMLDDLYANGLARERAKFLEKWNNPATNMTSPTMAHIHHPSDDPLAEFLVSTSGHGEDANPVKTYFFAPTPDGFYNQNGLSLQDFMDNRAAKNKDADVICVFPVFDSMGRLSNEMVKSVRNPQKPAANNAATLPTIQFVESYRIEVGWLGYGLGELSHSFNLFPGETKELVIEKSTKLKTKLEESRKTSEETTSKQSSSFEDNLQNELSIGEKVSQESSSADKRDTSQSGSSEDTSMSESSSSQESNFQASAEGSFFGFGSASAGGGSRWGGSSKSGSTSKRNNAWAASQSAEQKRASNQSKDILSKNISNSIRKVASETSQNNKLEFSAVSSREYEESTSNREVINLQNPNVGRTINYNFFQVQNLFGVTVKLVDVQVVIDSGVEMVKGTGINDVRVYELEEFGKVYANSDGSNRAAALSAIVVRQVMKHYGDFLPGVTSGSGAVGVGAGVSVQKEMVQILNFSSKESSTLLKDQIGHIKAALEYLKGVPFCFRETVLTSESTVAVNCGAYHVESQLGFLPATEAYLETRREIETEKQRAQVAHLKAQTEAKVFYPELPEGITSLNMDGKTNNSVNSDSMEKS